MVPSSELIVQNLAATTGSGIRNGENNLRQPQRNNRKPKRVLSGDDGSVSSYGSQRSPLIDNQSAQNKMPLVSKTLEDAQKF